MNINKYCVQVREELFVSYTFYHIMRLYLMNLIARTFNDLTMRHLLLKKQPIKS